MSESKPSDDASLFLKALPKLGMTIGSKLVAVLVGAGQDVRGSLERILRGEPIGSLGPMSAILSTVSGCREVSRASGLSVELGNDARLPGRCRVLVFFFSMTMRLLLNNHATTDTPLNSRWTRVASHQSAQSVLAS